MYTPINEFKLSKENQKIFKEYKKMSLYSIKNIYVPSKIYDDFLSAISPSLRNNFKDEIPFMGKKIIRI